MMAPVLYMCGTRDNVVLLFVFKLISVIAIVKEKLRPKAILWAQMVISL